MVTSFKYLSLIVCTSLILVGCGGPSGRPVRRRAEPTVNERRVSLEVGSLTLRDSRPHNVIVFLHKSDDTGVSSLTEYPMNQYIIMQPGDREDIQEAFVSIPESYADTTNIVITVVSVPDGTQQFVINSIGAIILDEIASKIPGSVIVRGIITLAEEGIANRLEEVVASGEILEMCDITLNVNGAPTQVCSNNQQRFMISTRQVVSAPDLVLSAPMLGPDSASPNFVNDPLDPGEHPQESVEDTVVSVVRRFNADQTIAMRELDLNSLRATSAGQWFDWQAIYMEDLQQQGLYEVQQQQDFAVLSVNVAGDTATVVTQETWRTAKFEWSTDSCRFHQPSFTTTQTYTLVQTADGWKIIMDDFEPEAPADIPGC